MIGRLKRTLKERCPECGKVLQLRVRELYAIVDGFEVGVDTDYICCSNRQCDYEKDVEPKRKRKKERFDEPIDL